MKVKKLLIADIIIAEGRQRNDLGDVEELRESIRARAGEGEFQSGLLSPIIVSNGKLVAGERRLRAHMAEGCTWIYGAERSSLSPDEAEMIELEENTKRKDLTWQERCRAIQRIHQLKLKSNPKWTQQQTVEYLGYAKDKRSNSVTYALALQGLLDDKLLACPTLESAYHQVARKQQRAIDDITNELMAGPASVSSVSVAGTLAAIGAGTDNRAVPAMPRTPAPKTTDVVLNTSFLDWAPDYSGPKFNFVHCDFPYGIDIGQSDQMGADYNELYADSDDIYWALLNCFVHNIDKFMYPSAHVMFWFSMEKYVETWNYFEEVKATTGLVFQRKPLIWHKSDGAGVVPDHRRRPRNTYEVALIGARADRFILEPVASSYAGPTASKKIHASEKPEPMLKHFFRMFVNEETSLFDPTAGGGSALRAADDMGAKHVLGLELNPEFSGAANVAFRSARNKRELHNRLGV